MNDKNLRYHEQGLAQRFGGEFVSKLEKLLDESNISDDILIDEIYDYVQQIYDRQDCQTWLIDQGLDSLADNKEFCKALCHRYRSDYDNSEYGTWDNISSAYHSIKDDDEWEEITAEAERLRDEEDGDYNDKKEDG